MSCLSLIVAMTKDRVIGYQNKMPWHLPEELAYFKQVTMGKPMIMGRATFDSIGRRLLPGRRTIVLTRGPLDGENFEIAHSREEALALTAQAPEVMVIGGATVYQLFLPIADKIYLSIIPGEYTGDTFFPPLTSDWQLQETSDKGKFTAQILLRQQKT